jgi:hypothetical protein
MTLDPHAVMLMALVGGAAWLMMQAGLAKNALEFRRKRHVCPSCGRHDGCSCGA